MITFQSILSELITKQKHPIGGGVEHEVYGTKNNSNSVFKVGFKKTIDKWFYIFNSNPNIFPIIYKRGVLKHSGQHEKDYVQLEKLNTKKVINEWDKLQNAFIILGQIDEDSFGTMDYLFRECLYDEGYSREMEEKLKTLNKPLYDLFVKWVNFLHMVNLVVQPIKGSPVDLHRHNFGYSSTGKMKCLDI